MKLTWPYYRVQCVACLGQVAGTLLSTIVGVIIPLMQILGAPHLSPLVQGVVGAATLIGIMSGAAIFGPLCDRYGYLFFYRFCPALEFAAAGVCLLFPSLWMLVACLFVMGCGIGGEYSLDSAYISEIMPPRWRHFMTGVAKAASSIGNIAGAAVCFLILNRRLQADVWPWLLTISMALALLTLLCRIRAHESPAWLRSKGREAEAARVTAEIFKGKEVKPEPTPKIEASQPLEPADMAYWKKVVLTGVPWACEGLGVYGFGIFLPVLLISMGLEGAHGASTPQGVAHSVGLTALINVFVLVGFVLGLLVMGRMKMLRQQVWGFVLCSAGLGVMMYGYMAHAPAWVMVAGFMAFELFLNAGPHLLTFVLPTRVFSVARRAKGDGVAAAVGKTGAVLGVFIIPILLRAGGVPLVLGVSIGVMLAGALVTRLFSR